MEGHSLNWARITSTPQLADIALRADDLIVEHSGKHDDYHRRLVADAHERRRRALNELHRRHKLD